MPAKLIFSPPDLPFDKSYLRAVDQNTFKLYKIRNERSALKYFSASMEKGLSEAFKEFSAKRLGGKEEFIRSVGNIDTSLGLKVEFQDTDKDHFHYIIHTNPFPKLVHMSVDVSLFSISEIGPKVNYFLGPQWTWTINEHFLGKRKSTKGKSIEYQIYKKMLRSDASEKK